MSVNFYIYIIRNTINGKQYIGQTTQDPIKYINHEYCSKKGNGRPKLEHAIKKYGWKNFKYRVLNIGCYDLNTLNWLESYYINLYKTIQNGYNIMEGGRNSKLSKETRNKLSEANIGKKLSEETKLKISKATRGHKKSAIARKRMSEANIGKKHSEETIKKLSEYAKKRTGVNNPNYKHGNRCKEV